MNKLKFKSIKYLQEDFKVNKRIKKLGELDFLKSEFKDPHIKSIIQHLVDFYNNTDITKWPDEEVENLKKIFKGNGHPNNVVVKVFNHQKITPQDVMEDITFEAESFSEKAKISPALYETMEKNIVESTLFGLTEPMYQKSAIGGADTFKWSTFVRLFKRIQVEHPDLFPLRNLSDHKTLANPILIPTPTSEPKYKQYNSINTAAATPTGHFIFNKPFCQQLLNWGFEKGLNPSSKKYTNNGGEFPPEWAYIETLIIHELYHYTYGDFHYTKMYKLNGQLVNYTGDFRSNYEMKKNGFEQLPIGLWSDHLNLDRYTSYMELYEAIKKELDKFPKKDQDELGEHAQDQHEHSDEETEGDGEPGEPGKKGKPKKSVDEVNDEVKEKTDKQAEKGEAEGEGVYDQNAKPTGTPGSGKGGFGKFSWDSISPSFNWKQVIEKCVKASTEEEENYSKPARSSISRVSIAVQTGSSAIKPGEVIIEKDIKTAFIVDMSGSMGETIRTVIANIKVAMKKYSSRYIYFMPFSSSSHLYILDSKTQKGYSVTKNGNKYTYNQNDPVGTIDEIISRGEFGGTDFSQQVVHTAQHMAKEGFNIFLATDSDVLYGNNFENLKTFVKIPSTFCIFARKSEFVSACQQFGKAPKNLTFLNKDE